MTTQMNLFGAVQRNYRYLQSIRKLKNFISFDMIFPEKWKVNYEDASANFTIIKNNTENGIGLSYVCEFKEKEFNAVLKSIDNTIKMNLELEEKEELFQKKVKELRKVFNEESIERLKTIKFNRGSEPIHLHEEEENELPIDA